LNARRDELHDRLDRYSRFGSGPELDRLSAATEGQELVAAFACVWRWKGWVGAATDAGLYLARNPKLLGRSRFRSWRWADLSSVRTGATMSVALTFGSEQVDLKLLSHDEFVALLGVARGPVETSSSKLRELARLKLGKSLAFGYEATIDALPDRLEPDERAERLAIATAEFTGMLVVTDRRVLLVDRGLRAERFWEAPRSTIRGLALTDAGFTLELESGAIEFREVLPLDRRDELVAVLRP
jgi:hypothetical protein